MDYFQFGGFLRMIFLVVSVAILLAYSFGNSASPAHIGADVQ